VISVLTHSLKMGSCSLKTGYISTNQCQDLLPARASVVAALEPLQTRVPHKMPSWPVLMPEPFLGSASLAWAKTMSRNAQMI